MIRVTLPPSPDTEILSRAAFGTTTTQPAPVSVAVWAKALAVFPADARTMVPPPLSLRRAKVGSASSSLNVQDLAKAPLSG